MLTDQELKKLSDLASSVCEREGCMLYDLEFKGGSRGRVLRVYIDKADGGATIDDCAEVSRGLSLLLDVEDIIPGARYELEVSTPGIERVLRTPWHFELAVKKLIRLKTSAPAPLPEGMTAKGPIRSVDGTLISVNDKEVSLVDRQDRTWTIPFEIIHRGKVIFEDGAGRPKSQRGK